MPEDRARPFLLEMEQVHLAAEPAMVAPLGFLDLLEIGVELGLLGEGGRIDALTASACWNRRANRRPRPSSA